MRRFTAGKAYNPLQLITGVTKNDSEAAVRLSFLIANVMEDDDKAFDVHGMVAQVLYGLDEMEIYDRDIIRLMDNVCGDAPGNFITLVLAGKIGAESPDYIKQLIKTECRHPDIKKHQRAVTNMILIQNIMSEAKKRGNSQFDA